jgi:DNA modification methylase
MKTFIVLPMKREREIPQEFQKSDNRFAECLVRLLIEEYTNPGDIVLDVFAGLGTVLFVAESMGRVPYGIELDVNRFNFIKDNLMTKGSIIHGDSRKIDDYDLPKVDLVLTSPPFMKQTSRHDPLTADKTEGHYSKYLDELTGIFRKLDGFLNPSARVILEVSNIKGEEITPLAWDISREISKVMHFEGEIVVGWEGSDSGRGVFGYGYDHSYCLVFRGN